MEELSIAEEKKSRKSANILGETEGDDEALTVLEGDLREKEKMLEEREQLTENTPEVRQEVGMICRFLFLFCL